MQHRFACSWCNARGGQCDFASLDDLETHIAAQHFNDIHGFYECLYPECWSRFATGRASLKHEFDVHLNDVLHSTPLKKRRNFVEQRLAIHDCLNESINVAVMFLGHGESNASNSESLTTNNDERNKSAKPQISLSLSVVESVAHPTQTQLRFVCSKCGQCDFASLDDLESHIVTQHFNDIHGFYECLYPKCSLHFPTELACLKHELEVHQICENRNFIIQRLKIHECLNESINMTFSGPSRTGQLETAVHQGQVPPLTERRQQHFYDPHAEEKKRASVLLSCLAINPDCLDEAEGARRSKTANSASKLRKSSMDNSELSVKKKRKCEHGNSQDEPSGEITGAVSSSSNRGDCLIPGNTGSVDKNNEMIGPMSASNLFVVKDEQSLFDELAETVPASSSHRQNLILNKSTNHQDSINESIEAVVANHSAKLILGNNDKQRATSEGANHQKYSENLSSERAEHGISVVKEEPSLIDELVTMVPGPSNLDDYLMRSNNELPNSKRLRMQNQCNVAHFRKTMNVEQALEYVEELNIDDAIFGADVFLEPPTNEYLSDEDSADEDIGGNMDKFNRNQLLANAELRVQAREGHQDDLFDEVNATPVDVDTSGPVTYPCLHAQLKWSKCGSFADLNAGEIDNAHLVQLTYHTPVQMFELFFSDDLYNMMKVQSELYAISLHKKFTVRIDELKAFIGIMLLSGYMDLPKWRMMWEQGSETHLPVVSEAMTLNRFEEIKRYLHFNENTNLDKTDKFSKVRPLLDHINARYKEYAVLERKLAVDESMVPYYGRHSAKQFIRGKSIRFGYKMWSMANKSGYLIQFEPYQSTGGKVPFVKSLGVGGSAIAYLVSHLPQHVSFHIYGDRFFTGLNLVHQLKMRNIGYTGTIQENRLKDCPLDRKRKRNSKNGHERGSYDWSFETSTEILACLWIDNGPVYMLSTVDAVEPIKTVERWSAKEKERLLVTEPNLVRQYNTVMCGVDRMDQNISRYRTGIRSKKWWFCVFSFCLDSSVQNAWQIYRIYNPNVTFLEFRRQIVQYYLHGHKQAQKRNSFQPQLWSKRQRVSEDIRYDRRDHWIMVSKTKLRCAECGKCTVRKCEKCGVGLHDHCFKAFHVD